MKILTLCLLALTLACTQAEVRQWTASDGRTLRAEFVSTADGNVTIKRRNDGRLFTLSLDKLSEADQAWVKENANKAPSITQEAPKDLDKSHPLVKLITGDWERHESDGLKYRVFGERKLLRSSPTLNAKPTLHPLVIYLHGRNGDVMTPDKPGSADIFANKKNYGKRACFILAPQAPKENETWSGKNGQAVLDIIEEMTKRLPIDEKRIYLTGYSMGAYGTFHLLRTEPKRFAAAVPIAGGGKPATAKSFKKTPIWVFHGAKDIIVKVEQSQEMVEALKKAKADVKYTEYPEGDHGIAGRVYQDEKVHEWMFQQSRQ